MLFKIIEREVCKYSLYLLTDSCTFSYIEGIKFKPKQLISASGIWFFNSVITNLLDLLKFFFKYINGIYYNLI